MRGPVRNKARITSFADRMVSLWHHFNHVPLTPVQDEMRACVIKHIARARIRQLLRKMKGA